MVSEIISSVSLIVALWSIKVSKDTARKQLEYAEKTEKRREEKRESEERQKQRDWQEAARRVHNSPFPITDGTMKDRIEDEFRKIRSERILRGRNQYSRGRLCEERQQRSNLNKCFEEKIWN